MEFRVMDPAVPPASTLLEAMVADLIPLYGRIDGPDAPRGTADVFQREAGGAFLVGFDEHGTPVCGGGVKRLDDATGEIKRMYVVPAARGRGLAAELLVALEDAARALGYAKVRLDTGPKQPHAERLYRRAGYAEIPDYNRNPHASFWGEKEL